MVFTLAGASVRRQAPVLQTPRLRLPPHRADDRDALHAIGSEPDVYRHIGGEPATTRQDGWMRLLRCGGMWPLLGDLGDADFQREITPSLDGMLELGWVLAAVLGWGDACLGAHREAGIISPENLASIRVAEKAGFRACCETAFHDAPIRLFSRDVPAAASA